MFFRLLPEVYLVIGKQKSLLQNILNRRVIWIDNTIANLIKSCENNNPISNEFSKYAQELAKNGWGKITESPIFVEKLRLINLTGDRQMHQKAPSINHATIKLTDKCNLTCDKCGKIFCPSCIKENFNEDISFQMLESIIKNLKIYKCKTVLLTGGEISLVPNLKNIYELMTKNGFNVILNTNGIKKLDNFFINTNIFISVFSTDNLTKIIDNYRDFKNITLITYFTDVQEQIIPKNWKCINRFKENHKITKGNLINTSIDRFHLRQSKDSCLDGKIVINQSGNVYPCLESIKSNKKVGNVNTETFEDIIQKLVTDFWKNKIDEHIVCKDCEFRYACNSCMFDNVKENCCYDMELGIWR